MSHSARMDIKQSFQNLLEVEFAEGFIHWVFPHHNYLLKISIAFDMFHKKIAHLLIDGLSSFKTCVCYIFFVIIVFNQIRMLQLLCSGILSPQDFICLFLFSCITNLYCFHNIMSSLVGLVVFKCVVIN